MTALTLIALSQNDNQCASISFYDIRLYDIDTWGGNIDFDLR